MSKNTTPSWACWYSPVIPELGMQKWEDWEFKVSPSYTASAVIQGSIRAFLKNKTHTQNNIQGARQYF